MSSEVVGVQGQIKRLCEKAVYTHCCGHNLSLVIVSACNIPIVRNTLNIVKKTSKMFVLGLEKMNLLKEVVQQNQHFTPNQKVVFNVCVTRWVENLDGYNLFLLAYPYIVEYSRNIGGYCAQIDIKLHLFFYIQVIQNLLMCEW